MKNSEKIQNRFLLRRIPVQRKTRSRKPEGYTEQSEQHTEGRENASAVETVSGQTDASKGQPTSGTTYSWVNPKLTGEERKEDNSASYTGQAEQNFYPRSWEYGQSGQNAYQNDSQSARPQRGGTQTGGQQRHMYQSYHIDTPHPEEPQAKKKNDRKVKKPMSVGKKWGMVIAMGAVFRAGSRRRVYRHKHAWRTADRCGSRQQCRDSHDCDDYDRNPEQ